MGSDAVVPASYMTCRLTDKLYAGLALNSQFGLLTKPDDLAWAGSPIAVTSKVFSANLNPTLAYRLTPALTLGIGLQIEYFQIRLNHGSFPSLAGPPLAGSRQLRGRRLGRGRHGRRSVAADARHLPRDWLPLGRKPRRERHLPARRRV